MYEIKRITGVGISQPIYKSKSLEDATKYVGLVQSHDTGMLAIVDTATDMIDMGYGFDKNPFTIGSNGR